LQNYGAKGMVHNALARAVFFNRLGELRDRTHENQRHRASGLNLVVAAIVLWNTVYLEQAVAAIRQSGQAVSDETLAHLSPLKWEHINLTGDYHWRKDAGLRNRKLRPLNANVLVLRLQCIRAAAKQAVRRTTPEPSALGYGNGMSQHPGAAFASLRPGRSLHQPRG
jgi:hypothetical protein